MLLLVFCFPHLCFSPPVCLRGGAGTVSFENASKTKRKDRVAHLKRCARGEPDKRVPFCLVKENKDTSVYTWVADTGLLGYERGRKDGSSAGSGP